MSRIVLVAMLCLSFASSLRAESPSETFAKARAAADRKAWPEAIAIAERLVESYPDHFDYGLFQSRLLSWADRNGDSAAAYERLYRRHPHRLGHFGSEWARQLLWSDRTDEALDVYRLLFALSLDDEETARDRALAYSWKGDAHRAATAYGTLYDRNPNDPSVRLQYARNLAWSGRDDEAARVLASGLVGEGSVEERVWLSQLARWRGRPLTSLRHAEAGLETLGATGEARERLLLEKAHAWRDLGDAQGAAGLVERELDATSASTFLDDLERGAGRPWLSVMGATSDDSDDLDITNLEVAGSWAPSLNGTLGASYREDDLSVGSDERVIRRVGFFGGWQGRRWSTRWHLRQGSLRDGDFDPVTGSAGVGWIASDVLRLDVTYERTDYESFTAIDREVIGQFATLSTRFRWSPPWVFRAGAGIGVVDGPSPVARNDRVHVSLDAERRLLRDPRLAISTGFYAFSFSERTADGYWSPDDFWAWSLGADVNPLFPSIRTELVLAAGLAVQRETPGETTTAGRFTARVIVRPSGPLTFEYRFDTNDSKVSSDRGFSRTRHALTLSGTF